MLCTFCSLVLVVVVMAVAVLSLLFSASSAVKIFCCFCFFDVFVASPVMHPDLSRKALVLVSSRGNCYRSDMVCSLVLPDRGRQERPCMAGAVFLRPS